MHCINSGQPWPKIVTIKRVLVISLSLLAMSATWAVPAASLVSDKADKQQELAAAEAGERHPLFAQMTIERRVIIRVPMMNRPPPPPPTAMEERAAGPAENMEWVERKGPKCIKIRQLRAASITTARGVDLMLDDRSRMRARLGRGCGPEDLYSGFYIRPNDDGALCAGRDRVLARSGADCEITDLKKLVLEKK